MKLIQEEKTKMLADEGKVFRHINTGINYGKEISLGYNYYEMGIPLNKKIAIKPEDFEEIDDIIENINIKSNHYKRLQILQKVIQEVKNNIQSYKLSIEESKNMIEFYPKFYIDIIPGMHLNKGIRFSYNDQLFQVLKDHIVLEYYYPNENTKHLYGDLDDSIYEEIIENENEIINQ